MSKKKLFSALITILISINITSVAFAKNGQDLEKNSSTKSSSSEVIFSFEKDSSKEKSNVDLEKIQKKDFKGWILKDGMRYYIKDDGSKATGWNSIDNHWYYFNNDGTIVTGIKSINNKTYYFSEDGVMNTGWYSINGNKHYFDTNGSMATTWKFINGYWYYFSQKGILCTEWKFIDNSWFYLNENGTMKTGWFKKDNNWYYLNENGTMATGWKFIDGYWYYFYGAGNMATGWLNADNHWYYLNESGTMYTGWLHKDNHWYYLNTSGDISVGWKFVDGYWYYFYGAGNMIPSGFQTINGTIYYFYESGSMASSTWIGEKYIYPNGKVIESYAGMCHSIYQYNLFKYMTNKDHQQDVDATAIRLHGGSHSNNCVYFVSECLRRSGFNIPNWTCNTGQLSNILQQKGFSKSYDLSLLKPGDVVFSGSVHAFIFMGWADDNNSYSNHEYAYIVDNQQSKFGDVLHLRKIFFDDYANDTNKATHFYYYHF